jgi:hypothetical protein
MKPYRLRITTTAIVSSFIDVQAENEEDAMRQGKEHAESGDALWDYQGLVENPDFEIDATCLSKD